MLFYVAWHPCAGQTAEQQKKGLDTFARWTPPKGLEFKGFHVRADGRGGLCICEADSAETILTAVAPWAGVINDYDLVPLLPIEKGVEILNAAVAFAERSGEYLDRPIGPPGRNATSGISISEPQESQLMGHSTSGLSGKAVIVTGAGRGIGEAIARLFAGEGAPLPCASGSSCRWWAARRRRHEPAQGPRRPLPSGAQVRVGSRCEETRLAR